MKALQLQGINQVALIETDIPPVGEDELLVKTGAAVICTSDLNDLRENPFGIQLPMIFGHEGAGTVVKTGRGVRGFRTGDHVATHPVHPCGKCANCLKGLRHLCSDMGHFGINRPGTFAEYYPVRVDRARAIDQSLPFYQAALAEPVCVCLEALQQARLEAGSRLLILGDGPFGVLMARLAGQLDLAATVIAGWMDYRLAFAQTVRRVNTSQSKDPYSVLLAENDGQGYDASILAVASPEAFQLGLKLLCPKGRLVVFSAIPGSTAVDLFDVHMRELEIVGACNDRDLFDRAVGLLNNPALNLGELVTHRFPLAGYRQAFDLAAHGRDRAMKIAFQFEGMPS